MIEQELLWLFASVFNFCSGMVKAVVDTCAEIRSVYSKHLKYTNATDKVSITSAKSKQFLSVKDFSEVSHKSRVNYIQFFSWFFFQF